MIPCAIKLIQPYLEIQLPFSDIKPALKYAKEQWQKGGYKKIVLLQKVEDQYVETNILYK